MSTHLDLVHVVLKLSSCRSLEQIIAVLRESARDITGAHGVTVVLRDGDKCFYVEENAVGPLWKGKRFPLTACISGWCMLRDEQVAIPDIYADERIPHDAYRPTFVHSLAMTPIRRGNPLGAIGAYWSDHHVATEDELATMQALGDSAAMAFENAQHIQALADAGRRKDAFLSMLAHELRNPLAPVRNGLHLLKLQGSDAEVVAEAAEMMDRQVVHMSRIVDDLLDVARINNGKAQLRKTRVDLCSFLRQCVDDRRRDIDAAGLTLSLEVPLAPIWLDADATRLTQVVGNVLDNARKYTPSGGKVAVSVHADPATRVARIDVADTGVGISPKMLPHIFETFMQADTSLDRTAGGLGLGLAIASGFARLHDGTITAHSEGLGKGSRFTVALPDVQVAEIAPRITPATAPAASSLRLLIIEDNRDSARTLQRLLKVCGYGANIAYDGSEGVEMARAERPDVILCDIGLPVMDGYTVAATLRRDEATSRMRLIAVTGYGSDEDREKSRTAGFDAHLVKPINLQELLGHIRDEALSSAR